MKKFKLMFCFILCYQLFSHPCITQSVDTFTPISLDEITVRGFLGEKINLCIENRIKVQDINEVLAPFTKRAETRFWQTEFWGKWITSAISACEYTGDTDLRRIIQDAVRQLILTQSDDGYIGNYAPDAHLKEWDVWGRKYSLLGLIAAYDLLQDKYAMEAAERLLDFTMTEIGPGKANINKTGNYRGMASGSILEPVILLHNMTGEKRYLDFARYIVDQWESADGPQLIGKAMKGIPVSSRFPLGKGDQWWSWNNGQKAYEMMSCYEGLLELYRITGDAHYIRAVEAVVKNIMDTEINICGSGAAMECWYRGRENQAFQARHSMETCVTMTWMKLLLNLFRITGNAEYMDQFEKSMYNALMASMHPDGHTFSKYTPLCGSREEGLPQPGMTTLHCCLANGPRAVMLIPSAIFLKSGEGFVINLYSTAELNTKLNDKSKLLIRQSTEYPKSGEIIIDVFPERSVKFALLLRIPAWSRSFHVMLNGTEVDKIIDNGYIKISRNWEPGDRINLNLEMEGKVLYSPEDSKNFMAIIRGPVVLVRDSHLGKSVDTDEVVSPVIKTGNMVEMTEIDTPENIWMAFGANFYAGSLLEGDKHKPLVLTFCDFASAGYGWEPGARYRVWLPRLLDPSEY